MMAIFIGVWLMCGVVSAGILVAYFNGKYEQDFRKDLSEGLLWGLIGGPITMLMGFFLSGFCRHGWRLWPKKP